MRFSLIVLIFAGTEYAAGGINPSECATLTTCKDCTDNGCKWCANSDENKQGAGCTNICATPIQKCSAYSVAAFAGLSASVITSFLI